MYLIIKKHMSYKKFLRSKFFTSKKVNWKRVSIVTMILAVLWFLALSFWVYWVFNLAYPSILV